MNPIRFQALTYKIDPRYAQVMSTKDEEKLKLAIEAQKSLFEADDVTLTVGAKTPSDFETERSVWIEAQSKSEKGLKSHRVYRNIARNPFLYPFLAVGLVVGGVCSVFNKNAREITKVCWDLRKPYTTESPQKFITRAFTQIKQELEGSKS
jgi:hypothetical protein